MNCHLLYSDTDSFLYEFKHTDFYLQLETNREQADHFDLSNYPKDHRLYNEAKKMVTLKFKDELAGVPLQKFIGLKPKMCSILASMASKKHQQKAVSRCAQRKMTHDVYRKVLESGQVHKGNKHSNWIQKTFKSCTQFKQKSFSLSCFDDKRFILDDGIQTSPHGHYLNKDVEVMNDINDDPDWRNEEMPVSPTWDEMIGNQS